MSFLMDELKRAEQSQRAATGPLPAVSSRPMPPRPPAPERRNAITALMLLVPVLFGGAAAAYYWMPQQAAQPVLPALQPAAPAEVPAAAAPTPPSAQRGYAALMTGDARLARSEYLRVLEAEPASLDALHGMAVVSLRQGRAAEAEGYYLRALQADPQDALAQAGLIGLQSQGGGDGRQAEARLQGLLDAHPELPFLHYALGNLYAGQNRWSEAQQAFFKAAGAEPDNPDFLFNLAVSLDRQHQPQQALPLYQRALAAAEKRPASFDRQQVGARLRALQK